MEDWESNPSETPKALRDYAERMKTELNEMRDQNKTLMAQMRQMSVGRVIESKGLNPKIASIIPDSVEADPEKVSAWLDEHSELFSAPKQAEPVATTNSGGGELQQTFEDSFTRMGAAAASAIPPEKYADVMAQIDGAQSKEDLDKIIKNNGNLIWAP